MIFFIIRNIIKINVSIIINIYTWLLLTVRLQNPDSGIGDNLRRGNGEPDTDERAADKRVRAGDGGVRGGGRAREVRGGDVHGGADEQDERAHRGLAADRRGDVRVRGVRRFVHRGGRGDHPRHAGEGRGGGDGVHGAEPPGGGGFGDKEEAGQGVRGADCGVE